MVNAFVVLDFAAYQFLFFEFGTEVAVETVSDGFGGGLVGVEGGAVGEGGQNIPLGFGVHLLIIKWLFWSTCQLIRVKLMESSLADRGLIDIL